VTISKVTAYYEGKTQAILRRYGPGPRVHYHTGLVDDLTTKDGAPRDLRRRLVTAQERTLQHAAEVWNASSNLCGEVLDVGCGLGGGAIFWAQEFGARVTALTCVESHLEWVSRFAAEAGVTSLVQPLLCDALAVPGENCFDAAVAVDSSCHLVRKVWFHQLASLLRPGGSVFISDCFLARPEYEDPFNSYWHTSIGSIDEYDAAASESGLRRESLEDISPRAEHFWTLTLALIEAEALEQHADQVEAIRLESSRRAHSVVRQGLRDGGLRYALMSFTKEHR
jgi:tocopherol O-methyltransferase